VTLTISWASFPEDGRDRDELLRAADRRLHAVKDDRSVVAGSPAFAPGPGAVSVALGAA
jgi:GGDEF domain-containing protein